MVSNSYNGDWRTAKDPKSGRTYYYNIKTRESTWKMPLEMASAFEQESIRKKANENKSFFNDMEENIRRMMRGEPPLPAKDSSSNSNNDPELKNITPARPMRRENSSEFNRSGMYDTEIPRRYRTISSIDDEVVELMKYTNLEENRALNGMNHNTGYIHNNIDSDEPITRSRKGSEELITAGVRRGSLKLGLNETPLPLYLSPPILAGIADAKQEISNMADIKDLSNSYSNGCKGEFDETAGDCDGIASPKVITRPPPPALKRRNSTGTIYVETTMACQDNNAMIHVVCVVIRAHMLSNAQERHKIALSAEERALYDIFNEDYNSAEKEKEAKDARVISNRIPNLSNPSLDDEIFVNRNPNPNSDSPRKPPTTPSPPVFVQLIPSLAEIEEFFCTIYNKSQLESECIIMALIYCERIIIKTKGKLKMVMRNWKAILFACIVMASKVWDDLSMWNVDFSHVSNAFDLKRVNELELALLDAFGYEVKVSASEYAKYYFQLRSLKAREDFSNQSKSNITKGNQSSKNRNQMENISAAPNGTINPLASYEELKPLDIEGARKLQLATEKYEHKMDDMMMVRRGRSTTSATLTIDHNLGSALQSELLSSGSGKGSGNSNVIFSPKPVLRRFHSDSIETEGPAGNGSNVETTKKLKSPIGSGSGLPRSDIHYPGQQYHPVLLEQLMHSTHSDADGLTHSSKSNSSKSKTNFDNLKSSARVSAGSDCK